MEEGALPNDGFRAMLIYQGRYDITNTGTLLGSFAEVVSPPKCSGLGDVLQKLDIWETKVQRLSTRYNEELSDKLRMAIVISMLEKSVQDKVYDKNLRE